jgi:hypothetical protein
MPARVDRPVALVPPQHGAWAFLGLPLVVGVAVAPWTPVLLLLAYPWSYFILAIAKERTTRHPRPERFRRPLVAWSLVAIPGLVALLLARPWLVWVGLAYALAFGVNIAFAMRRDDRDLVNDIVFILECTAIVPVAWAIGAIGRSLTPDAPPLPATVVILALAVALLLTGSTLHVKSLIRERAHPGFARLSQGFAIVSVVASVGLAAWWGLPAGLWLVPAFAFAAGRSMALRGRSPRPARIRMIELAAVVLGHQ